MFRSQVVLRWQCGNWCLLAPPNITHPHPTPLWGNQSLLSLLSAHLLLSVYCTALPMWWENNRRHKKGSRGVISYLKMSRRCMSITREGGKLEKNNHRCQTRLIPELLLTAPDSSQLQQNNFSSSVSSPSTSLFLTPGKLSSGDYLVQV